MRQEELLQFFDKSVDHMRSLVANKNHDYAGPEAEDALSNFTTVELLGAATTEQGFLTRMTDKFKRVITFSRVGVLKVADEKVTDALLDLANYCILMAAYISEKQKKGKPVGVPAHHSPATGDKAWQPFREEVTQ